MKNAVFFISILMNPIAHSEPTFELQLLNSLELRNANLSLDLDSEKIAISGTIPETCAHRISLSNVQIFSPSKSEDELQGASIEAIDDLKDYAKTVQLQITYSTSEEDPSLSECLLHHSSEAVIELSKIKNLSRIVSLRSELVVAGLMGESAEIKSPEFQKLEKQFLKMDCKDCHVGWKNIAATLDEASALNSPFLLSMKKKLLDQAFEEIATKIPNATSLDELIRIRNQLNQMSPYIDHEEQQITQVGLFEKLIDQNGELSKSGLKTESSASRHADFNKDTFSLMASLKNITPEMRDDFTQNSKSMAVGSKDRVLFISSMDGDHPEVKKFLDQSHQVQNELLNQIHQLCRGPMNQENFTRCGELQARYSSNMKAFTEIHSRYTEASNLNWIQIFNRWDSRKIQYNPQWKSMFLFPGVSFQILGSSPSGSTVHSNYSNFDSKQLYLPVQSQNPTQPLFQEQPYSIQGMQR